MREPYFPRFAISAVGGGDRGLAARTIIGLCEGLTRVNIEWRRSYPNTPTFLQSTVKYHDDSRVVCSGGRGGCHFVEDDWADWKRCLDLGYGDCEDFGCEIVAEERLAGRKAWPLPRCYLCDPRAHCQHCGDPIRSRLTVGGDLWHIQVAIEDGPSSIRVVDPSRERGMRAHPDGDDLVVSPYDQAGVIRLGSHARGTQRRDPSVGGLIRLR